jgi:uridylate kinase
MPAYSRILLKLSGELLRDERDVLSAPCMADVASSLRAAHDLGVQIGVVVGGGNLVRGRDHAGDTARPEVDQVGMLATVMNVALLRLHLERAGLRCRVLTPREIFPVSEAFERRTALAALADGEVLLLGGGTGNPYFSTDSAAALRAIELECDAMLKGTMVDGVYDKDPRRHPDARRFDTVSYDEVLRRGLEVMDHTAIALCRDHGMKVVVFDLRRPANLVEFLEGRIAGTIVAND